MLPADAAPVPLCHGAALRRLTPDNLSANLHCRCTCRSAAMLSGVQLQRFRSAWKARLAAIPDRADCGTRSTGAWHIAASRSWRARSPRPSDISPAIAALRARARRSPSWPAAPDRGRAPSAPSPLRARRRRSCASNRASMRATSSARSGSMTMKRALSRSISGVPRSACHSRIERPDAPAPPAPARCAGRRPACSVIAACGSSRIRMRCSSGRALLRQLVAPAVADRLRNVRHLRNALRQRAEIEPGAADEDRRRARRSVPSSTSARRRAARRRSNRRCRGMDMAVEQMRRARAARPRSAARSARRAPNRPAWNRR